MNIMSTTSSSRWESAFERKRCNIERLHNSVTQLGTSHAMSDSSVSHPQQQHQQGNRTCPCKKLPLRLSSFTAAEQGNVHALERFESSVAYRKDAGGSTPLHLAAQHGHVSATAMLLRRIPVNATGSGATALHRASFSGAVATMRLLLADPACALLQTDTSFGDCMTPLHKAASGGRYLAVQLLVDALLVKDELQYALVAVDNMGRTPVEVARDKQQDQDEEQKSVTRWDVVAGGTADWGKCVQLLIQASGKTRTADLNNNTRGITSGSAASASSNLTQQALPEHLAQGLDCLDCDENGRCLTSSWESAFRTALSVSVSSAISGSLAKPNASQLDKTQTMNAPVPQPTRDSNADPRPSTHVAKKNEQSPETNAATLGQNCTSCGTTTIVLYKSSSDGQLVCKTCRRRKRADVPK
jgi:ankyrin repeat protein